MLFAISNSLTFQNELQDSDNSVCYTNKQCLFLHRREPSATQRRNSFFPSAEFCLLHQESRFPLRRLPIHPSIQNQLIPLPHSAAWNCLSWLEVDCIYCSSEWDFRFLLRYIVRVSIAMTYREETKQKWIFRPDHSGLPQHFHFVSSLYVLATLSRGPDDALICLR